ncbi:MAG: NYN domain-containing protein [Patescibacteria group bacterium]
MIKHSEQRVGVLVDVANMYHSAKNLFGSRLNFKAMLDAAVGGRRLTRAIAYAIKSDSEEEVSFFEALDKSGFEVKTKDLQIFSSGAKKADWDVGIAIDAVTLASKVDVIVLVTGDGDFIPLVEYLQMRGLLVEAIGFGETTSGGLKAAVDDYIDLSSDKRQYLMRSRLAMKAKTDSKTKTETP